MRQRMLVVLLVVLVAGALAAVWWLSRRPLSYEARRVRHGSPTRVDDEEETEESIEPAPAADAGAVGAIEPPILVRTVPGHVESLEETENYLLAGVDRTWGRGFGRADTIVLAVFDDATEHVGLVSVPRDLLVEVPGHGPARINATLRIAEVLGEDPLELLRRVVSDTLAVPIHHVVVGDLGAFERTIDRIGGVTVNVPCPIEDAFLDREAEGGRRWLRVAAGRHLMDGRTAAMYVRSRHGRSDWDRARRQQAVLLALRDRVRELPATEWIPILSGALEDGVTTTMSRFEMIALAQRVSGIARERMHGILLGHRETTKTRTVEGRWVLVPKFDAIDEALRRLFEAPAPGVRPERARCPDADVALRRRWGPDAGAR